MRVTHHSQARPGPAQQAKRQPGEATTTSARAIQQHEVICMQLFTQIRPKSAAPQPGPPPKPSNPKRAYVADYCPPQPGPPPTPTPAGKDTLQGLAGRGQGLRRRACAPAAPRYECVRALPSLRSWCSRHTHTAARRFAAWGRHVSGPRTHRHTRSPCAPPCPPLALLLHPHTPSPRPTPARPRPAPRTQSCCSTSPAGASSPRAACASAAPPPGNQTGSSCPGRT